MSPFLQCISLRFILFNSWLNDPFKIMSAISLAVVDVSVGFKSRSKFRFACLQIEVNFSKIFSASRKQVLISPRSIGLIYDFWLGVSNL